MKEVVVKIKVPEIGDRVYFYSGTCRSRVECLITQIEAGKAFYGGFDSLATETTIQDLEWNEEQQMWLDHWHSNFDGWWPTVSCFNLWGDSNLK